MWFKTQGKLTYGPGIRAAIKVDQQLSNYYRTMIPKHFDVNGQRHPAHITVVRIGVEKPPNMDVWEKHQGLVVEFEYSNMVEVDGVYWFLRARSEQIAEIRKELGLPEYFDRKKGYHITLGNTKKIRV
jgi:hypothetical protein